MEASFVYFLYQNLRSLLIATHTKGTLGMEKKMFALKKPILRTVRQDLHKAL